MSAAPTSVAGYADAARTRLADDVWRYLGDGCARTHAADRRAFDAELLVPRPLADVRGGHTRLELFGQALEHPILVAPIAYQRVFHTDGECACAMAAAAQGAAMVISSLASQPLEAIAGAHRAHGAAPWFQLYWLGDRDGTLRLATRAANAGCVVTMFTVDAPVKRAEFMLPPEIAAVNLARPLAPCPVPKGGSVVFDGWMAQAPTWDDLAWLRERIRGPLVVKGLLHPDDAARAAALGCDGIVVSNHGGRVLEGLPASLTALPAIRDRLAGRVPLLLDSGVRSGRDVLCALRSGASAVMIGRPVMWGLASDGAFGVARVIRMLRDELEAAMALCGERVLPGLRASPAPR